MKDQVQTKAKELKVGDFVIRRRLDPEQLVYVDVAKMVVWKDQYAEGVTRIRLATNGQNMEEPIFFHDESMVELAQGFSK